MTEISNNFMKGLHVTTEWPAVDALVAGYMRAASIRALQEIRQEMSDFEEEVFHEPNTDYKAYASVRYCIDIIDKHIKEIEE